MKKNPAFTLVELLIVIAIVAAISVITTMSYTALQSRTKASNAVTLANQVSKKAEGWYSVLGSYPTYTQLSTGKINVADATQTGPIESRISDPSSLFDAATGVPVDEKVVGYKKCTVGAQVEYYDALAKSVVYIGIEGATSAAACT